VLDQDDRDNAGNREVRFDPKPLELAAIMRLATKMKSDVAFDTAALTRLRRDSQPLDGVRLTDPCPYRLL